MGETLQSVDATGEARKRADNRIVRWLAYAVRVAVLIWCLPALILALALTLVAIGVCRVVELAETLLRTSPIRSAGGWALRDALSFPDRRNPRGAASAPHHLVRRDPGHGEIDHLSSRRAL
jgi:hypothetical protein